MFDHEGHVRRNSGVVICNVSKTPVLQYLPVIPSTEIPKSLNQSTVFYSQDENIKNHRNHSQNSNNTQIIFILFLSIIFIFIFIIL